MIEGSTHGLLFIQIPYLLFVHIFIVKCIFGIWENLSSVNLCSEPRKALFNQWKLGDIIWIGFNLNLLVFWNKYLTYFRKASKVPIFLWLCMVPGHGNYFGDLKVEGQFGDLKVEGQFGDNLSFFIYSYLGRNKILFVYMKIYLINFQWRKKHIHDNVF